jgi:hypothetical protein
MCPMSSVTGMCCCLLEIISRTRATSTLFRLLAWRNSPVPTLRSVRRKRQLEVESKEVQPAFACFDFVDTCFVSVDFQSKPLLDLLSDKALQPRSDLPAQEDEIVCVPDQFDFCPFRRSILAVDCPIKPVKIHVGQQRRDNPTLRYTLSIPRHFASRLCSTIFIVLILFNYRRFQPLLDQLQHCAIDHSHPSNTS